jgi:hypothetical protein
MESNTTFEVKNEIHDTSIQQQGTGLIPGYFESLKSSRENLNLNSFNYVVVEALSILL